jgi:hypothetical protein
MRTAPKPPPVSQPRATCRSLQTLISSRSGGSRTPNRWIWNPVLCQLSYAPLLLPRFFVHRMLAQFRAVFLQFQTFGTTCFFLNTVIPVSGFSAFQPNIFAGHHVTLRITNQPQTGLRRMLTSIKTSGPPRHDRLDGTPAYFRMKRVGLGENLGNNA